MDQTSIQYSVAYTYDTRLFFRALIYWIQVCDSKKQRYQLFASLGLDGWGS